jgi:hypothetical protein
MMIISIHSAYAEMVTDPQSVTDQMMLVLMLYALPILSALMDVADVEKVMLLLIITLEDMTADQKDQLLAPTFCVTPTEFALMITELPAVSALPILSVLMIAVDPSALTTSTAPTLD